MSTSNINGGLVIYFSISCFFFWKLCIKPFHWVASWYDHPADKERWFHLISSSLFPSDWKFLICTLMFLCFHIENGSLETCMYIKFNPLQLVTTSNCNQRRGSLCTYSMSIHTTLCFLAFIPFVKLSLLFHLIQYWINFSSLIHSFPFCFFSLRYGISHRCMGKTFCNHHIKDLVWFIWVKSDAMLILQSTIRSSQANMPRK